MGNLEFCPKCGKLLLPQKEGKKAVLKCRNCGATYQSKDIDGYKLKVAIPPMSKERVAVIEGGTKRKTSELTEDERVEAYRQALDYYQEEEESPEET
jgi:DNA-directed RNA polymerase subunit M/transcription elongation factor TFIIS